MYPAKTLGQANGRMGKWAGERGGARKLITVNPPASAGGKGVTPRVGVGVGVGLSQIYSLLVSKATRVETTTTETRARLAADALSRSIWISLGNAATPCPLQLVRAEGTRRQSDIA